MGSVLLTKNILYLLDKLFCTGLKQIVPVQNKLYLSSTKQIVLVRRQIEGVRGKKPQLVSD